MEKYVDRYEAGKILAEQLKKYANDRNTIVLGLARGGVPVAYEIARTLSLPLDVLIVRKLGVPGHEELAMGAIVTGDLAGLADYLVCPLKPVNFYAVGLWYDDFNQTTDEEIFELLAKTTTNQ